MHDGQNLFDLATSYGGVDWDIEPAILGLIAEGITSGVMVVGVWNGGATQAQGARRGPAERAALLR